MLKQEIDLLFEVGEQVLDLVIPYIHNVEDRSSVSLVSRKFYEIDGITRKHVTVQVYYYPNPASLSKRFPFIESLTLKGPPSVFNNRDGYVIGITPWIEQLAIEFRSLKELRIRNLVILDEDLETLARTRGKDLRSLIISKCKGFLTDELRHVSKYCNQLRSLCLGYFYDINVNNRIWLHELALNSTVLERLHVHIHDVSAEDLTLLAKNCCNSLISLKVGSCYLSELRDTFRYAVMLEHFGGYICDEESDLVGFHFPQNTCSISLQNFSVTSIRLPFLNNIRKLNLMWRQGLQVIGKFCKKLRKLTHHERVTHVGLIALTKGCINLESLHVVIEDISNEALECVGIHLKNLRDFRIWFYKKDSKTDPPLDNGVRAMLMGCRKLESLDISFQHGGLTDVGLDYIGKYGANLKSLSLTRVGNSNEGLVKLSEGCQRLRKLKLKDCPFMKQGVASIVFNMPSLRYVWFESYDRNPLALTRPERQL